MAFVPRHTSKINIQMVSASSTPWGKEIGHDCSNGGHLMGQSGKRKPTKIWSFRNLEVAEGSSVSSLGSAVVSRFWFCLESDVVFASMVQDKGDPGYVYSNKMLISMVCLSMTTPFPSQETQCILWMNCIWFSYELFKPPSLGLECVGDEVDGKAWNQCFTEVLSGFLPDPSAWWLMSDTFILKCRTEPDGKINWVTFSSGMF